MEQPAEGSAFALSVADYLAQAHSVDPPTAELLDRVWRSIDDTVSLPMGRAHGDLAPWNVGMYQGRIVVWDWEDSRAMMPIGIDLVHWHFQMGLAARDHVRAVRSAMAADKDLSLLGLEAGQRRLVLFGYVIEHLARRLTTGELPIMEARAAARDLQARYQSS